MVEGFAGGHSPAAIQAGAGSRARLPDLLAALPAAWLFTFFFAPLILTVAYSFGQSSFGSVRLGFTLANYAKALSGFNLWAFVRTLQFAVTACMLCLVAAFPAALFIARHSGRHKTLALTLVLTPYFTSFLIRVMSWQILLARDGPLQVVLNALHLYDGPIDLMDTQAAVLIGMVYSYLPIAIVPLYVVLARIPQPLIDASRDLGAGRWKTLLLVILPLAKPGIATAVLLTAVPMLGELVIPNLLGGSRGVLMGQAIAAQFIDAQDYALGSAMAVLVLVAVAALIAALAQVTRGFAEAPA